MLSESHGWIRLRRDDGGCCLASGHGDGSAARATDGLALRAAAEDGREAAQDQLGVADRLGADFQQRFRHATGAVGGENAGNAPHRVIRRHRLPRKDIHRELDVAALGLANHLREVDDSGAAHEQEG